MRRFLSATAKADKFPTIENKRAYLQAWAQLREAGKRGKGANGLPKVFWEDLRLGDIGFTNDVVLSPKNDGVLSDAVWRG